MRNVNVGMWFIPRPKVKGQRYVGRVGKGVAWGGMWYVGRVGKGVAWGSHIEPRPKAEGYWVLGIGIGAGKGKKRP